MPRFLKRQLEIATIRKSGLFDAHYYLGRYADVRTADIDPLLHYCTQGWQEGRRPNPLFDTSWYVSYYPDVQASGLNPLYHFIKHGASESRAPSAGLLDECAGLSAEALFLDIRQRLAAAGTWSPPPELSPPNPAVAQEQPKPSPARVAPPLPRSRPRPGIPRVFVSCWMRERELLHDGLEMLAGQFAQHGIRTTFLTPAQALLENPLLDCIRTEFLCSRTPRSTARTTPPPDWLDEVARMEQVWLQQASGETAPVELQKTQSAVLNAYGYWKDILERKRPSLMLAWGSTAPISKLHLKLCQELGIPTAVLERGHFPETLSFELLGQFAQGANAWNAHLQARVRKGCSRDRITPYLDWARSGLSAPYATYNVSDALPEAVLQARKAGRRVVLFIGSNDNGSGSAYAGSGISEIHSSIFASSASALEFSYQRSMEIDPDCLFVYKPHPSDKTDYGERANLLVCRSANIYRLIEQSDLCITLSTTATTHCLVEEVPVVALGLSDLSGLDIFYECRHLSEVPLQLRAAMAREDFSRRCARGYAFIHHLFEEKLVGVRDDCPTTMHIQQLADFLSQRIWTLGSGLSTLVPERETSTPQPPLTSPGPSRAVDIVIPVYGDAQTTKACIDSVLAARTQPNQRVVIICDKSPYPEVCALVDSYADQPGVVTLHNPCNLGFPGTANRGMALARENDVILLNSDTLVHGDWVERLQQHAYSAVNVATVTPFSNNASIFSIANSPQGFDLNNPAEDAPQLDSHCARMGGPAIEVPVGHGFCLYIRRATLDAVGCFDEPTFGRGYSEEVDFCLRARSLGLTHLCATNVFVAHVGGVSFAESGDERRLRARKIIEQRYPDYFREIREFGLKDPLEPYRLNTSERPITAPADAR